jgi:hypothetical protein
VNTSQVLKKYGLATLGVGELMWAGIGNFHLFARLGLAFCGVAAFLVAFNPKSKQKPRE